MLSNEMKILNSPKLLISEPLDINFDGKYNNSDGGDDIDVVKSGTLRCIVLSSTQLLAGTFSKGLSFPFS